MDARGTSQRHASEKMRVGTTGGRVSGNQATKWEAAQAPMRG